MSKYKFPYVRMRRNRNSPFIRDLLQENTITVKDLVYPLFIIDGVGKLEPITSMPGQMRYSIDQALIVIEECIDLGILAIALFPVINTAKDNFGSESYNPNGLVQRAVKTIKDKYPQIVIFTDVALDPYTIHGQDGIIDDNRYVLNDVTNEVLVKQALSHAKAGADFVAPSDMMDGRVVKIRRALEEEGFYNTGIMSYSIKYASSFYGPFRDAVHSSGNLKKADKKTYQMNPANINEAYVEAKLDIEESADIIMVKPGIGYLDVVYQMKTTHKIPVAVYHVSGEYSMLKAASQNGWIDYSSCLLETMLCFKRARADIIWTYSALDVARLINQ